MNSTNCWTWLNMHGKGVPNNNLMHRGFFPQCNCWMTERTIMPQSSWENEPMMHVWVYWASKYLNYLNLSLIIRNWKPSSVPNKNKQQESASLFFSWWNSCHCQQMSATFSCHKVPKTCRISRTWKGEGAAKDHQDPSRFTIQVFRDSPNTLEKRWVLQPTWGDSTLSSHILFGNTLKCRVV